MSSFSAETIYVNLNIREWVLCACECADMAEVCFTKVTIACDSDPISGLRRKGNMNESAGLQAVAGVAWPGVVFEGQRCGG